MTQETKTRQQANAKHTTGGFWWTDLQTSDVDAAKTFYTKLLGWTFDDMPAGDGTVYSMAKLDGLSVGALSGQPQDQLDAGVPSHWNSYLTVDDLEASTKKVTDLGGRVIAEPFDVLDVGRMSVIADPQGAVLMLWQAGTKTQGAELVNVPGAMVWNELNTTDVPGAKKFYGEFVGWELQTDATPMGFEYTGIKYAGTDDWVGGMMELPDAARQMGAPANWLVYFALDDVDAKAQLVEQLGGKVLMQPFDIPETGRIAVVQDPQGAVLAIMTMANSAAS